MKTIRILTRALEIVVGIVLCTLLTACMTTTPVWDANFGNAVRQLRAMQTLNPDASSDTDPVTGIDGKSANTAMTRYDASMKSGGGNNNAYTVGIGANGSTAHTGSAMSQ